MIRCMICGKELNAVNGLHLRIHNVTVEKYKEEYPNAEIFSELAKEKMKKWWENEDNREKARKAGNIYLSSEATSRMKKGQLPSEKTKKAISRSVTKLWGDSDYIKKQSESRKGRIPWNKNLTKETDERVANFGKTVSESLQGNIPWNKDKKGVQVSDKKGKSFEEYYGPKRAEEIKCAIRKTVESIVRDPKYREEHSKIMLSLWKDPEFVAKVTAGWNQKPNDDEQKLIFILGIFFPQFGYNGNGSLQRKLKLNFDGLVPDFLDITNKRIIEYFGFWSHTSEEAESKIARYAKIGWDCLIIWPYELKDDKALISKIGYWLKGGIS